MHWVRTTALVAGAGLLAGGADAQTKQQVTGPVATYWMSAQTHTGMGGGGGAPSPSAMMGMMMGGGGQNVSKSLMLQLGSSRKPTGEPTAEHLPPVALKAGQSLPLVTPKPTTSEYSPMPKGYEPKGKMLIYWGCGERAKAGQPVVIDFAKVAKGEVPPAMQAMQLGTPMQPPSLTRNTTYGEWPNRKTNTAVPGAASLVGDHFIRGNYSPDIKFALNAEQDFLGPLSLTKNQLNPSGSGQLAWSPLANARAYLATAIGGGEDGTVVMWTSSEVQATSFAMSDFISNADITKLVNLKALMAPTTTSCTIPQEVIKAAPSAMVQLAAFGGETNISYPPRPEDPKTPWNIDWTLKVRYKSMTGGMLGMDMASMMRGDDEDAPPAGAQGQRGAPQQPTLPGLGGAILKGLGGRLPGL